MNASAEKDLIRRYLLSELPEEELTRVEERLITDGSFFKEVLAEEEEMIDAYVHDRMAGAERERFESSYLSTPEGREQVALARSLLEYVAPPKPEKKIRVIADRHSSFFSGSFPARVSKIAAVVIILVLPLGVWRLYFYQSDVDAGMVALNQAYSKRRTVEARLTGMNHSPLAQTRGNEDGIDSLALDRAEKRLSSAASADPGAEPHHALGRLYLMKRDFTRAIEQFRIALTEDERNPEIHNDLGAALLERAKAEANSGGAGREEALRESLRHLDRSVELDGSFAEAFFNRGLLHEEMSRADLALADWNRYLELDPSSEWSDEVREHIDSLKR